MSKTQTNKVLTAQEWMPICDVEGDIAYRTDGALVSVLRILPVNIDLMSPDELALIAKSLSAVWNAETLSFQIVAIGRPLDLDSFLGDLQDQARSETHVGRRAALNGYIREAIKLVASGGVMERQFYMILIQPGGAHPESLLLQRLYDLESRLNSAGLRSHVCHEQDIIRLFMLFAAPISTANFSEDIGFIGIPAIKEDA